MCIYRGVLCILRIAISWRCQSMFIFLLPLSFIEYQYHLGQNQNQGRDSRDKAMSMFHKPNDLPYPIIVHLFFSICAWSGNVLSWIYALQFTTTVRASLLSSLHPIFLVIYLYCTTNSVTLYEWCGVMVSLVGLFIIGSDGMWDLGEKELVSVLVGDALCLIAAASQVMVIITRRQLTPHLPLMQVNIM